MKHLFITFISVLCLLCSVGANAEDNDRTKLTIKNESFTGIKTGEIYRDLSYYVSVTLIAKEHLLEILHYEIGDGGVYLLDGDNQVVDEISIFEGAPIDLLEVPDQSGYYKLVIWSDLYYGEAYFQI